MDQYLDNRHKEILWELLANPAEKGKVYKQALERLVQDNPQSGLLQVMLARTQETPDITKAAAYFSPKALYKIINDPEGLQTVPFQNIVQSINITSPPVTVDALNVSDAVELQAEPAEQISHEPVSPEESLIAEEHTQPVDNIAPDVETASEPSFHQPEAAAEGEKIFSEQSRFSVEEEEPLPELPVHEEVPAEENEADVTTEENKPEEEEAKVETYDEPLSEPEQEAVADAEAEPAVEDPAETAPYVAYETENVFHKQDFIEDEVYDEIVSIDDIGIAGTANKFAEDPTDEQEVVAVEEETVAEPETTQPAETEEKEAPQPLAEQQEFIETVIPEAEEPGMEPQELAADEVAGSDYHAFDQKLEELRNRNKSLPAFEEDAEPANEKQDVSMYNDDKMPYSFMWWLDKTRREHASAHQPYAPVAAAVPPAVSPQPQQPAPQEEKPAPAGPRPAKKPAPDKLQQQYYENIFSLTSVSSISKADTAKVEFDHTKKEDVIIERFIHTDPQIKPLSADKLDNENKAKRSSEDQDIMVTETLARIYGDQMLYHKAIATYKKLMLKLPEKNTYFAAQIEQLEKKIN